MNSRAYAIDRLSEVLDRRRTLDEVRPPAINENDARFVEHLVLTTLRHLGQMDTLISRYLDKPLPPKRVRVLHALRIGVAQLLLLETPAHAAVHATVDAVKMGKDKALAGLVNAVLQRVVREKPSLPEVDHNIPAWLAQRWRRHYGKEISATIATVAAHKPPVDLHLPTPATLPLGERLDALIWRLPPEHPPIPEIEGFAQGAFWVQDIAASYPVRLLGDVRGRKVLDLAAAPGGKTAQLARAGAVVTAVDKSAARMRRLSENMKRIQCEITSIVADINQWQPEDAFDAIVLDAPCSATGTWRKHPEVLQLTAETDITELVSHQRALLQRAWQWLKPGGLLVYCVCSLEREEGEDQAEWFAHTHKNAKLAGDFSAIPETCRRGDMLRTHPALLADQGGMDGFFAACFKKREV